MIACLLNHSDITKTIIIFLSLLLSFIFIYLLWRTCYIENLDQFDNFLPIAEINEYMRRGSLFGHVRPGT